MSLRGLPSQHGYVPVMYEKQNGIARVQRTSDPWFILTSIETAAAYWVK